MRLLLATTLGLTLLIEVMGYSGNDCNCSRGYVAKLEEDQLNCVHLANGKIRQCIPSPHCKCMENAIKVRWGKNAAFCAYGFNSKTRIWPCENKEDWKTFRNKLKEKV